MSDVSFSCDSAEDDRAVSTAVVNELMDSSFMAVEVRRERPLFVQVVLLCMKGRGDSCVNKFM